MPTVNTKTELGLRFNYLFSLLTAHGVEGQNEIFSQLQILLDLIVFWENTHNIMSKKLSQELIVDSIIDSVEGASILSSVFDNYGEKNIEIIDAGSGGGFPGIPLSIMFQDIKFLLVDSDRKKCSFLRFIKSKINIKNIEVINSRLEKVSPAGIVVTRAAFPPQRSKLLAQAVKKGGFLAIWSTPEASGDFEHCLITQAGLKIYARKDYELGRERKKRCVLVFENPH